MCVKTILIFIDISYSFFKSLSNIWETLCSFSPGEDIEKALFRVDLVAPPKIRFLLNIGIEYKVGLPNIELFDGELWLEFGVAYQLLPRSTIHE